MSWDEIFKHAVENGVKVTVKHYGGGMFTLNIDGMAESDLTEEEAQQWAQEHLHL